MQSPVFFTACQATLLQSFLFLPCTILSLLVAFSTSASFQTSLYQFAKEDPFIYFQYLIAKSFAANNRYRISALNCTYASTPTKKKRDLMKSFSHLWPCNPSPSNIFMVSIKYFIPKLLYLHTSPPHMLKCHTISPTLWSVGWTNICPNKQGLSASLVIF